MVLETLARADSLLTKDLGPPSPMPQPGNRYRLSPELSLGKLL